MNKLTHTDSAGKARMVDTGSKNEQHRVATAAGRINLKPETVRLIRENQLKKGDVITVSEIAGIQAAKRCSELIPLCHNIVLNQVTVKLVADDNGVSAEATAKCTGRTGVEMEALTAVSVALLTVYDMCKAADKEMTITGITLLNKEKHDIA